MSVMQLHAEVQREGVRYERNPADKAVGLRYATLLRMTARDDQALAVMRKLATIFWHMLSKRKAYAELRTLSTA